MSLGVVFVEINLSSDAAKNPQSAPLVYRSCALDVFDIKDLSWLVIKLYLYLFVLFCTMTQVFAPEGNISCG